MTETSQAKSPLNKMVPQVLQVITAPVDFFKAMPKSGGFLDPLLFMVVLGVVAGIIRAVFSMIGIGMMKVPLFAALTMIVMTPIMIAIFGFVGAAILFVIWKLMGSQESYETSYRCCAYASAITPITALFGLIPYVGALIAMVWALYLLVVASTEVHKIAAKTAWIVFGIIFAIFALLGVSSERKARSMAKQMKDYPFATGSSSGTGKDMTPEEQGRAMSAFVLEMQKAQQKAEEDAKKQQQQESGN